MESTLIELRQQSIVLVQLPDISDDQQSNLLTSFRKLFSPLMVYIFFNNQKHQVTLTFLDLYSKDAASFKLKTMQEARKKIILFYSPSNAADNIHCDIQIGVKERIELSNNAITIAESNIYPMKLKDQMVSHIKQKMKNKDIRFNLEHVDALLSDIYQHSLLLSHLPNVHRQDIMRDLNTYFPSTFINYYHYNHAALITFASMECKNKTYPADLMLSGTRYHVQYGNPCDYIPSADTLLTRQLTEPIKLERPIVSMENDLQTDLIHHFNIHKINIENNLLPKQTNFILPNYSQIQMDEYAMTTTDGLFFFRIILNPDLDWQVARHVSIAATEFIMNTNTCPPMLTIYSRPTISLESLIKANYFRRPCHQEYITRKILMTLIALHEENLFHRYINKDTICFDINGNCLLDYTSSCNHIFKQRQYQAFEGVTPRDFDDYWEMFKDTPALLDICMTGIALQDLNINIQGSMSCGPLMNDLIGWMIRADLNTTMQIISRHPALLSYEEQCVFILGIEDRKSDDSINLETLLPNHFLLKFQPLTGRNRNLQLIQFIIQYPCNELNREDHHALLMLGDAKNINVCNFVFNDPYFARFIHSTFIEQYSN